MFISETETSISFLGVPWWHDINKKHLENLLINFTPNNQELFLQVPNL